MSDGLCRPGGVGWEDGVRGKKVENDDGRAQIEEISIGAAQALREFALRRVGRSCDSFV